MKKKFEEYSNKVRLISNIILNYNCLEIYYKFNYFYVKFQNHRKKKKKNTFFNLQN